MGWRWRAARSMRSAPAMSASPATAPNARAVGTNSTRLGRRSTQANARARRSLVSDAQRARINRIVAQAYFRIGGRTLEMFGPRAEQIAHLLELDRGKVAAKLAERIGT